jgi:hypothetical protein
MTYLYEAIKPTRIYHKQCSHCGLNYLGKTVRDEIENYTGSGVYWQNHLKKHNAESIHIWNSNWFYDTSIVDYALDLSEKLNIVESKEWANAVPEDGLGDGGPTNKGRKLSPQWRENIASSVSQTKNSTEWKETVGKEAREKDRKIKNDPIWRETVGRPSWEVSKKKQIDTKSDPIWKSNNSKTCEHCGKKCDIGNYNRWHGDRCNSVVERVSAPINKTIECPHCKTVGKDGSAMRRWHFDKCKERKS